MDSYEMIKHTRAMNDHKDCLQQHAIVMSRHNERLEYSANAMEKLSKTMEGHAQSMQSLKKTLETASLYFSKIQSLVDRLDTSAFEMSKLSLNLELNALTNICGNKELPEHIRKAAADTIIEYVERNYIQDSVKNVSQPGK